MSIRARPVRPIRKGRRCKGPTMNILLNPALSVSCDRETVEYPAANAPRLAKACLSGREIASGCGPHPAHETQALLRLRAATFILLFSCAVFLVRHLVGAMQGNTGVAEFTTAAGVMQNMVVIVVAAVAALFGTYMMSGL